MRKLISILLVVLMLVTVIACDPDSVTGNDVTFAVSVSPEKVKDIVVNAASTSEDGENKNVAYVDVTRWTYTAVKGDDGYTTGETKEETDLKDGDLTLSLGSWTITVNGYSGDTLTYTGTYDTKDASITADSKIVVKVNPEEGVKEEDIACYKTLAEAITASADVGTVKLLGDITPTENIVINDGKSYVVDLNGKNISFTNSHFIIGMFKLAEGLTGGGTLKITGKGKVSNTGNFVIEIIGNNDQDTVISSNVYIDKDVELEGAYAVSVYNYADTNSCYDVNVDIYGTLIGHEPIYVSGNIKDVNDNGFIKRAERVPAITIHDGAKISSVKDGNVGMYIAGYANLVIGKADIRSLANAITICAGKLEINGATVIGGTTKDDDVAGTGGAITSNQSSAVYVKQHGTNNYVDAVINSGEFSGYIPFRQDTGYATSPQPDKVTIAIKGGTFTNAGTAEGTVSVKSANKTEFITGGTFSTNPDSSYIADGYEAKQSGNTWTVAKKTN